MGKYHAAVCGLYALLGTLGDALVCAVFRAEEDCCGPVVACDIQLLGVVVLGHGTCILKSSLNSQVVQVDSFARSWPF